MSFYNLRPNIKDWNNELNPFIATIIAYDDNNKRISGKQLYIVYDITYDNSLPDIENNKKVLFSDKDGRIELHFDNKCNISLDLYMVSEFDETLDLDEMADEEKYICHHICNNLFVPLQAYITDVSAEYIGSKLEVTEEIPRKYIDVTVKMSDNTVRTINLGQDGTEDFIITPNIINSLQNTITISYRDNFLEKTWYSEIEVEGKPKETGLSIYYRGETKKIGQAVSKSDLVVTLFSFNGEEETSRILAQNEWDFTVPNIITNKNLGLLEIGRGNLRGQVKVPFYWEPSKWRLEAWYEGYNIIVGEKINLNDLRIWLWEKEGVRKLLDYNDCVIDPDNLVVTKEGLNWFIVSYTVGAWTVKDKFAIIGYRKRELVNEKFKLLYYNPNIQSLEDVTKLFEDSCSLLGNTYINWERLLNRIIETSKYGDFIMNAPPFSGLCSYFGSEWLVSCHYRKAISSQLKRIYTKEDYYDG